MSKTNERKKMTTCYVCEKFKLCYKDIFYKCEDPDCCSKLKELENKLDDLKGELDDFGNKLDEFRDELDKTHVL